MFPRIHLTRLTCLLAAVLATAHTVLAMETDQFTVPLAPLYDIGQALSRKVIDVIESDRKGTDPERVLSDWVGTNIFGSRILGWVNDIRSAERSVRFRPNVFGTIFGLTFAPVPGSFLFDSPTVNIYGFYAGTDKIDHFFQQGHEYYEIVMQARTDGSDSAAGIAAAVARGVQQEHTYFGTLVSGIYSNGDLAANFAGMKFYLNLRESVRIGGRLSPPLLERATDGWRLRSGLDREQLLRPFFSDHVDESLNPSRYRFSRGSIRSRIRDRCERWKQFYADRLEQVAPSGQGFAATWFGEDYGHWLPPSEEASIATECVHPDRGPDRR